jgi:hypothetical protein
MVALISDQLEAMQVRYPQLTVRRRENICEWIGGITPIRKEYKVRVTYELPLIPSNFSIIDVQPSVMVLTPQLERHPDYEEGPIPHIYPNPRHRDFPRLCLFDPYSQEWSIDDLIAETTMPWAERWLGNYEFWLATTLWKGGGVHYASSDFGQDNKPEMRMSALNDETENA